MIARKKVEEYNDWIRNKRLKKAREIKHNHDYEIGDLVWLYAKQTCPKEESFDVKKELKRVLRGYHLPDTHPDKPKGYFESITARVTASVTAEIATLPGGVQVVKRPLWGVAIITTAQVPNTNMQYMWIGAFGTWYYINGKALGPSPSTGSKVDHKKNSDSSKKD